MADTKKPVLNIYGPKGNTWAGLLTGAVLSQTDALIHPVSAQAQAQSGDTPVTVGGVSVTPKYLMTLHGAAELEFKNKLKQELKLMMQQNGQDPKLLEKLELSQMLALKKELVNTPASPSAIPKLTPPTR